MHRYLSCLWSGDALTCPEGLYLPLGQCNWFKKVGRGTGGSRVLLLCGLDQAWPHLITVFNVPSIGKCGFLFRRWKSTTRSQYHTRYKNGISKGGLLPHHPKSPAASGEWALIRWALAMDSGHAVEHGAVPGVLQGVEVQRGDSEHPVSPWPREMPLPILRLWHCSSLLSAFLFSSSFFHSTFFPSIISIYSHMTHVCCIRESLIAVGDWGSVQSKPQNCSSIGQFACPAPPACHWLWVDRSPCTSGLCCRDPTLGTVTVSAKEICAGHWQHQL